MSSSELEVKYGLPKEVKFCKKCDSIEYSESGEETILWGT